jgi:hypothetical protein
MAEVYIETVFFLLMQGIPMDLDLRRESSDIRREGVYPTESKVQLPLQG